MRKLLIALAVLAAGCTRIPMLPGLSAHKIEVQQGNYLTQEMVSKLKPGMTRSQVRYVLGTPLVSDPFHSDRWDYVYQMQKGGQTLEFRKIFVVFDDDKLVRIEGDVVTAKPEAKDTAAKPEAKDTAAKPEAKDTAAKPEAKDTAAKPEAKGAAAKPEAKDAAAKPDAPPPPPKPAAEAGSAPAQASPAEAKP